MLQFEDGSYVKLPYVHYDRVKAFTIEPVWEHCNAKGGSMDIDGENYGKTSVEVQCHKGLCGLCFTSLACWAERKMYCELMATL
jgi:hypothetical protein